MRGGGVGAWSGVGGLLAAGIFLSDISERKCISVSTFRLCRDLYYHDSQPMIFQVIASSGKGKDYQNISDI